ncbi:MAG: hypothetical protein M1358_20395 [Chloroflexi bacterium]|nr:hypothetical protein [Chloroflexota bacterium]
MVKIGSDLISAIDPYWSLVILLPGIYATLFQIFGRRRSALPLLWAAGALGFVVGQALAEHFFTLTGVRLGSAHILEASLAAWVLVFVANRVRLW